jgi:CheY-like chemotaxis protein
MKNILIVDDNKYILDGLLINLRATLRNCAIFTAGSGKKALEILKTVPVDFLLADLHMPVMDGYELIRFTKKKYPHIPVFAMSDDRGEDADLRIESLGVLKCIRKPLSFRGLSQFISQELKVEIKRLLPT